MLQLKQNNMKKLILVLMIITAIFAGCKKGEDEVIVKPIDKPIIEIPKPFKIEITTDKASAFQANYTFIEAYNIDEPQLKVKVSDKDGNLMNEPFKITVNGNDYIGNSFKTDIPGDYIFEASVGTLISNKHTIKASEIAEKYITIESSYIQSINSVGKVIATIKFKNISNKRLKYVGFKASCYNSVNDIMKEEITGRTTYTFNATGFWEANSSNTPSYEIGYYTGAKSVKIELYSVTLEDGKIIYAK